MFEVLSSNHYLTKAKFLSSSLPYFYSQSTVTINKLAFAIYDSRKDGKITVDEISDMFASLLYGSEAYLECLKYYKNRIVNLFLSTIFEKSYKKVTSIDFDFFQEIIGVSCIGLELLTFIQLPLEDLSNRIHSHFVPINEKPATVEFSVN